MIKVNILSPVGGKSFEAEAVFLPGTEGNFEVLDGHAAIISSLEKGMIVWRNAGKEESMEIKGGVMRLKDNIMTVCVK